VSLIDELEERQQRAYMLKATRDDWNTPLVVVHAVRRAFDGQIDLDPCSNPASVVGAAREFILTPLDQTLPLPVPNWEARRVVVTDGLVENWDAKSVFLNPPFGALRKWVDKCAQEYNNRRAMEIVALIPARTDTRAWHEHVVQADAICLWRGRMKFSASGIAEPASAPFPTALVYWGRHRGRFAAAMEQHGLVFYP
jgi:hypothetical protein